MANVRIFVDFWNFQLAWNSAYPRISGIPVKIDWRRLPPILMGELPAALGLATENLNYKGVNIYASVNPDPQSNDAKLRNFLHKTLNQFPGFQVQVFERKERPSADATGQTTSRTVEKGVDTKIVTDLFEGAINATYDIAVLISNDADFCPAIRAIQDRLDRKVIHAGFKRGGDEIRSACWSHFVLDGPVSDALRSV